VSVLNHSETGRKNPILCYVTDSKSLALASTSDISSTLLQKVAAIAAAGVDWIQFREKHLSARSLSKLAREASRHIAAVTGERSKPGILVNDRIDVALAEHTDGVHLGEQSVPVDQAKLLVESRLRAEQEPVFAPGVVRTLFTQPAPKTFLLGVSCHSLEAAKSAATNGADYIFFGPIFATPSKAAFGAPQGVNRLAEVCRVVSLPVLAIGGITIENAPACFAAGASGIAAIRLFQESLEPARTVDTLRRMGK
jgi:thiamine-phosphate pyrophosphorylase